MACSQGTSAVVTFGGVDPALGAALCVLRDDQGRLWRAPEQGRHQRVASGISNTMNTPVEVLEMAFPVRVERYEINPDSGARDNIAAAAARAAPGAC